MPEIDWEKLLPLTEDFSGYDRVPQVLLLALRNLVKQQRDQDKERIKPLVEAAVAVVERSKKHPYWEPIGQLEKVLHALGVLPEAKGEGQP